MMTTVTTEVSPVQHLKSVYIKTYNPVVKAVFKEIDVDDLNLSPKVSKKSLLKACLVTANDSQIIINNRSNFFHLILRKARDYHPAIVGNYFTETEDVVQRSKNVKIMLKFVEDGEDVDDDYDPVPGRISYRLMDETATTISKSKLISIGNRIKAEFGVGRGWIWKKGKSMFTYIDRKKGYQFQLLVRSESDGKEIVNKVLDLESQSPDWKLANYKENLEPLQAYPYNSGSQTVLGEVIREPRRRPLVSSRFQSAFAWIPEVRSPVCLYDKSYSHINALVDD